MKRLVLLALIHAACAVDDPSVSIDEAALTSPRGFEIENGSVSGSVQRVVNHERASNGAYLAFNGAGYARVFWDQYESSHVFVWARVIAPSTAADSIYFQFDSETPFRAQLPVATTWTWVEIEVPNGIDQGQHSFKLTTDEPGVLVDRVLFAYTPAFVPIADVYEAEHGSLVYPLRIATQKLPYTTYVYTPNGYGGGGRLDLDVTMPEAGSYYVWVRANAVSTSDNSIMTGRDGVPWGVWDMPITSSGGWTWAKKSTTMTFDIFDVLSIQAHDDGVKIDKILLTNDQTFRLIEASPPPQSTL